MTRRTSHLTGSSQPTMHRQAATDPEKHPKKHGVSSKTCKDIHASKFTAPLHPFHPSHPPKEDDLSPRGLPALFARHPFLPFEFSQVPFTHIGHSRPVRRCASLQAVYLCTKLAHPTCVLYYELSTPAADQGAEVTACGSACGNT